MKLVVFDLDGTLNRTDLYFVPADAQVRRELGYPPVDDAFIISTIGGRSWDYIKQLIPGATSEEEKAYLARKDELDLEYMEKSSAPFDGIPQMLDRLHAAGCVTAVCSNSSIKYIEAALKHIGIRSQIDEIQSLQPGLSKVETLGLLLARLKPERAVMVGDRYFDLEAARKNSIPFVGCRYGYCPAEIETADYVAGSPAQVGDQVLALFDKAQ